MFELINRMVFVMYEI